MATLLTPTRAPIAPSIFPLVDVRLSFNLVGGAEATLVLRAKLAQILA